LEAASTKASLRPTLRMKFSLGDEKRVTPQTTTRTRAKALRETNHIP